MDVREMHAVSGGLPGLGLRGGSETSTARLPMGFPLAQLAPQHRSAPCQYRLFTLAAPPEAQAHFRGNPGWWRVSAGTRGQGAAVTAVSSGPLPPRGMGPPPHPHPQQAPRTQPSRPPASPRAHRLQIQSHWWSHLEAGKQGQETRAEALSEKPRESILSVSPLRQRRVVVLRMFLPVPTHWFHIKAKVNTLNCPPVPGQA